MKFLLVAVALFAATSAYAAEPCRAGDLKLTIGGRDGEFTGMSHDGAWIMLQNISSRTCSVPRRPPLTMQDQAGKRLDVRLNTPRGMHPGPVLVPIVLKPKATAKGKMQWVMGEVYDHSICADADTVSISAPGGTLSAPLRAHMCGQKSDGIFYDQEWMQPPSTQHNR